MFAITGGYHRYFAHQTYKTSRAFQFVLAVLGATATQKGVLWWAGHHRIHHKYSDQPGRDVHSPQDGFWYSHQGWIFHGRWDGSSLDQIQDFARFPELVWLNRWHVVPPIAAGGGLLRDRRLQRPALGLRRSRPSLLWHATYSINSLAHRWGTRRYDTPDTSRNNLLLGLLTLGEGWHNNHHHYCASARQGFFWWEIDVSYYLLRALAAVGLIWDVREPPAHVVNRTARAARSEPQASGVHSVGNRRRRAKSRSQRAAQEPVEARGQDRGRAELDQQPALRRARAAAGSAAAAS